MHLPATAHSKFTLVFLLAATALVWGQQNPPQVLLDLDTTPVAASSNPTFGAILPDGRCVFAARTLGAGLEPWIAGPGGPSLLKDLVPGTEGSAPRHFVRSGPFVYFTANDLIHGSELWRTDGTVAGTVMVTDLTVGAAGALPEELVDANGTLFFTAFDASRGRELYTSDGTAAGTAVVTEIVSGVTGAKISQLVGCGSGVFFVADDGVHGDELFVSDGTAAGTVRLTDLRPGVLDSVSRVEALACCDGKVFFRARDQVSGFEPFVSDGTVAGTFRLADIRPGANSSDPGAFTCCNGEVFFAADAAGQIGRELFKTNGTVAGTVLVKDIFAGSSDSLPNNFVCCGNELFFAAAESSTGQELYKTDGTAAGTVLVKDVFPGFFSSFPSFLTCCNGLLYFRANAPNLGRELWVSDGTTAGTQIVIDSTVGTSGSGPQDLFCCGTTLLYSNDVGHGRELFSSDGTAAGSLEHDLDPAVINGDSDPRDFVRVGPNEFFFTATTATLGRELVFFNGNGFVVHDIEPGPNGSSPEQLTEANGTIFFSASTSSTGRELFRATRTAAPVIVSDHRPGSISGDPREITPFAGSANVAFSISDPNGGREPAVAGDMVQGIMVADINAGTGSSSPTDFETFNVPDGPVDAQDLVAFAAFENNTGREPYVIDAHGNATMIADFNPGPANSNPKFTRSIAGLDDEAIMTATTTGSVTQVSSVVMNSTSPPTLQVNQKFQSNFELDQINSPENIQNRLIGLMMDLAASGIGNELFTFDPQNGFQAHDLNPGPNGSNIEIFNDGPKTGSVTYFTLETEAHGREIGSIGPSGTPTIHDLIPGPESSNARIIATIGDQAVILALITSDDEDLDHFILDENGNEVRLLDNPADTPALVSGREAMRFGGDLIVAGSVGGSGVEPVTLSEVGGMSESTGRGSSGSFITASDAALGGGIDLSVSFFGIPLDVVFLGTGPLVLNPFAVNSADYWLDLPAAQIVAGQLGNSLQVSGMIPNDPVLIGTDHYFQAAGIAPGGPFLSNIVLTKILQISL